MMLQKYNEGYTGRHVKMFFEVGWPFWEENLKKESSNSFLKAELDAFWSVRGQTDENGQSLVVNFFQSS